MESFRSFILAAQKRKKCPPGYKFNKKLGVCVPIGQTQYYPYYGARSNGDQQTDTSNNNGQNGNGSNGIIKVAMVKVVVMAVIITQATEMVVTDHEKF